MEHELDVLWPKLADPIFITGKGAASWTNTAVNWKDDNLEDYGHGYLRAAECLLMQALRPPIPLAALVHPICFLFRHYLELELKLLIGLAHERLGKKRQRPTGHRLIPLWTLFVPLIQSISTPVSTEDYESVREKLEEIDRYDGSSEAFRYSVSITGSPTLQTLHCINLSRLEEAINEISEFMKTLKRSVRRATRGEL